MGKNNRMNNPLYIKYQFKRGWGALCFNECACRLKIIIMWQETRGRLKGHINSKTKTEQQKTPLTWMTTSSSTRSKVGRCICSRVVSGFKVTKAAFAPGSLVCRACRGSSSADWQAELQQELHVAHWHIFLQAASISLAFHTFLGHFMHVTAPRRDVETYSQFQQARGGESWAGGRWVSSPLIWERLAHRQ